MPSDRRFVYVLHSITKPNESYVGITSNITGRLKWHNTGPSGHTLRYRPWAVSVVMEFPTENEARRFERYLKSGSGRAFAKRHFAATE
jgi:putative endonuclease